MTPHYLVAYLIKAFENLSPPLEIGGKKVSYLTEASKDAEALLRTEIGDSYDRLRGPAGLPCVEVNIEADDPDSAVKKAWEPAQKIVSILSLLEFESENAMSMVYENSPSLLPNVLVADMDMDIPTLEVKYYVPHGLLRVTLGELGVKAKGFNDSFVRHIGSLIPAETWVPGRGNESEALSRLEHSLQWYSTGMSNRELELRFVAMWFALESLVIESMKTDHKKRKLTRRLSKLYYVHNSDSLSNNILEELWSLRTKIVHEALSGHIGTPERTVSAEKVNVCRYFYFVALLFVLDMMSNYPALPDMWANLSTYQPSMRLEYDEVPLFYDVLNLFRFSQ